jgi:hypothetical protein
VFEAHPSGLAFLEHKATKNLVKFCKRHPALTVRMVLKSWCLHQSDMIQHSMVIAERFRNGFAERFTAGKELKVRINHSFWLYVGEKAAPLQLPSNVRIFPVHVRVDKRKLRDASTSRPRARKMCVKVAVISYFIENGL